MDNSKIKKTLIIMIIVLLASIFLVISVFAFIIISSKSGRRLPDENESVISDETYSAGGEDISEPDDGIPSKTVFAVYGVDKGGALSDVIIVASFDKIKNTVNSLSIPRDTYVRVSDKNRKELKSHNKNIPSGGIKINAVHSYSGEYGNEYLSRQIEELLGVHIDYYFEIDLNSFVEIVDAVGGVEIDVPSNMYYKDPTQKQTINIKKGLQVLDGKTAQGFVRFRQYLTGDIERIEAQKKFIKALLKKITSTDTILSNLTDFISIFINNVTTNMTIKDAVNYAPYIKNISVENVTMETLPGDGRTPYRHDESKTRVLVDKLFYDVPDNTEINETYTENHKK